MDISKLSIEGCEEAIAEMKSISDKITSVAGNKIQIADKIAELRKQVTAAQAEQAAADSRGDRAAYESAFDRRGSLLVEIDELAGKLADIKSPRLMERYELIRRKIYDLESEAEDALKAAQKIVEDRKPLRVMLQGILSQIGQLNS